MESETVASRKGSNAFSDTLVSVKTFTALPRIVSCPEQGRADTHVCGTMCNGRFEIAAHSHGQVGNAISGGHVGQGFEVRDRVFGFGGNAHQAKGGKIHGARVPQKGIKRIGQDAGLLGLGPGVDHCAAQLCRDLAQW